jgi:hypothetical protein
VARDHYLPASWIGRFSTDPSVAARDRVIFAGRKGSSKVFQTKAEKVGYTNNLYRVSDPVTAGNIDPNTVDTAVSGYESALPVMLDCLDRGELVALQPWLRTLVPFVASIFVRGNDFATRFEARPVIKMSGVSSSDYTNGARLIEFQRLLAPVLCARWVVLHQKCPEPLILNNLGVMPTRDLGIDEWGWAVPIGMHAILGVFPRATRTIAQYRGGSWRAVIEHGYLNAEEVQFVNRHMALSATEWIIGPDRKVVQQYLPYVGKDDHDAAPIMERWPFDHATLVAHLRDWHRLISATANEPTPDALGNLHNVDVSKLSRGWCPPVIMTLNMMELPTGLRRSGNLIRLTLRKPDNYKDYFIPSDSKAEC